MIRGVRLRVCVGRMVSVRVSDVSSDRVVSETLRPGLTDLVIVTATE